MSYPKVNISDVVDIKGGYAFKSSAFGDKGSNIIRIANIKNNTVDIENTQKIKKNKIGKGEKYQLFGGEILIALSGATTGKVGLVPSKLNGDYYLNQRVGNLSIKENVALNSKYLFNFVKSPQFKKQIDNYAMGGAQPNISPSQIGQFQIPLPPLPIQKKIAEVLDKADELRQIKKKQIEKLDELIQSIFLDMFGDPVTNPKGWEEDILGEYIYKIQAGKSLVGETRPRKESELGVLKVSAVTSGVFKPKENKAITDKVEPRNLIFPKKGDLLISRANTRELVLASCIVNENFDSVFLPDKLWNVITDENRLTRLYLKYVLTQPRFRYEITKMATGTSGSMLNISQEKFRNIVLPIPPITIQLDFAKKVKNLNSLRIFYMKNLLFTDNLFNSLMQRAFKGELEFRE